MNFSLFSIKRRVFTYLSTLTVVILGMLQLNNLPVSYWPDFTAPVLLINTRYPGASAGEVEDKVTRVLEAALSSISGVDEIESTSSESFSTIIVRFIWEIDLQKALNDVQEQLNIVSGNLPREASRPQVLKVQNFLPPSIQFTLESEKIGRDDLQKLFNDKLSSHFLKLPDVASVEISGGREKFLAVELEKEKLVRLKLSPEQVAAVIGNENIDLAAGKIRLNYGEFLVKTAAKFSSLQELQNLVIAYRQEIPIKLGDIARIRMRYTDEQTIFKYNGRKTLGVGIRKKSDGNAVRLSDDVRYELARVNRIFPDLKITIIKDESTFIRKAIRSVLVNALLGAVLAGLILFIFLGNLTNTLVIAFSIPVSIIGSALLMSLFGLSLNTISLGGLALAVGMIVDASIVMLENIERNLRIFSDHDKMKSFYWATRDVTAPIIASILTSLVVFLPLTFLKGIAAVLLGELALTVVFALGFSLLVSLGLVPLLAFKLLQIKVDDEQSFFQKALERFIEFYQRILAWLIQRKIRAVGLIVCSFLLFIFSLFFVRELKTELIPVPDEGEFRIESRFAPGTNIVRSEEFAGQIGKALRADQDVETIYQVIGQSASIAREESNLVTTYVLLKKKHRPISTVIAEISSKLNQLPIPAVSWRFIQSSASEGIVSSDLNLLVFGDDLDLIETTGREIFNRFQNYPGLINLDFSLKSGKYELQVVPDRQQTIFYGLSSFGLARQMKIFYDGLDVGKISLEGSDYDIRLLAPPTGNSPNQLELVLNNGFSVGLNKLAAFNLKRAASKINRLNQQRFAEIKADLLSGKRRELEKFVSEIKSKYNRQGLLRVDQRGASKGISESFKTMAIALLLSLFLVYVVLGSQFNSFFQPFLMAFSIPLALIGMIFTLYFSTTPLNLNSFLGGVVLVGIAVNNGILLIDLINKKRIKLTLKEALLTASAQRVRPILMTAMTTIFGMLPLAIGFGEGVESLVPLARAVCGGLFFSTLTTFFVVPVLYYLLYRSKLE